MRTMRPRQWVKNVLVLAAPFAAGSLLEPGVAGPTALAFVAFCLVSSGVYCFNDCADVEADRLHPLKRTRPIAAGELSVGQGVLAGGVLTAAGLAVGALTGWPLLVLLASYVVLQLGYVLWLKHEPVLDIAVVALGFLLRAVAGGLAADLPISDWFLLVTGFGSLFMVAGKRYSELHTLGGQAGTRRSLVGYTGTYLRFVWTLGAAATLMSYSLWAFENSTSGRLPWHTLSIAPFAVGLLRYAVDIDSGSAAEPEDIVWGDRTLQLVGACWLLLVGLGVLGV